MRVMNLNRLKDFRLFCVATKYFTILKISMQHSNIRSIIMKNYLIFTISG